MAQPPTHRPRRVRIDAPARIHLGVLDLRRGDGRYFGGMGVALTSPRVRLTVEAGDGLVVEGPEAELVREIAGRHLERLPGSGGAEIRIRETIPRHAGLGSGTQLALAVARALDLIHGEERPVDEIAPELGRGERSAVGSWCFERGGFVLEGGVDADSAALAPLLCRFDLPESWRVVLVRPEVPRGLSGAREEAAFEELPPPDPSTVGRVAQVVLMELLPAVATGDLDAFGLAAERVEGATGEAFSDAQGGSRYAHDRVAAAVELLRELGAAGTGQSSWGPTVYGFVDGEDEGRRLEEAVADRRPGWWSASVRADNRGARHRVEAGS